LKNKNCSTNCSKIIKRRLKDLFKQLDELLQTIDKNDIKSKIDELKLSEKDIEKELDRTLNYLNN
jgi:hypothetical protein